MRAAFENVKLKPVYINFYQSTEHITKSKLVNLNVFSTYFSADKLCQRLDTAQVNIIINQIRPQSRHLHVVRFYCNNPLNVWQRGEQSAKFTLTSSDIYKPFSTLCFTSNYAIGLTLPQS